jgi:hypothetical protein
VKTAQSVNFAYDPRADRIELYACYEESAGVTRVELTRRYLSRFLPSVSARVSEQGLTPLRPGTIAPSVQHNRETAAREHRMAQQIPLRKKQVRRSQLNDLGFLAHTISLKSNGGGLLLTIASESKDRQVYLQMTVLELHRFIDQLTALAAKAEWGLADPWARVKSEDYRPGMAH